jgi:hypothetical protein
MINLAAATKALILPTGQGDVRRGRALSFPQNGFQVALGVNFK